MGVRRKFHNDGNPRVAGFLAAMGEEFACIYCDRVRNSEGCECRWPECHGPVPVEPFWMFFETMARIVARGRREAWPPELVDPEPPPQPEPLPVPPPLDIGGLVDRLVDAHLKETA